MSLIKSIFLVEDDTDDQLFFTDALNEIDTAIECTIANNGKEALERLKNFSTLPGILFLDLNMPLLNGYEFLKELKNDPRLKHIPVVIFSTSNDPRDAEMTRHLGADVFLSKPNEFSELCSKLFHILQLNFNEMSQKEIPYSL